VGTSRDYENGVECTYNLGEMTKTKSRISASTKSFKHARSVSFKFKS
jgi:hypothetical protein